MVISISWVVCRNLSGMLVLVEPKNVEARLKMGLVSFKDKDGNFGSAADVWNPDRLEQLFNELNPNRKLRLEREKLATEEAHEETQNEE